MKKFFKYIEPLWLGDDGKVSIRRVLALIFSINFVLNVSQAVNKWDSTRSLADFAMILGIEAGLIVSLLSLTTYSNFLNKKIDAGQVNNGQQ